MNNSKANFTNIQPENTIIDVQNLNAWFGSHHVLYDVSLPIAKGKVTAIIGPSGCGKSTFIRTLNRMHELTPNARFSGKIILDGHDIHDKRVNPMMVRKKVGMVFQKPNPFPMMSIKENVLAGFSLQGVRFQKNTNGIVEQSLKQAALWDEVKDDLLKSGAELSGGQQQRLCIARSLAMQPDVLLMDEPCSALDPIATTKIEDLIHTLSGRYSVVIVTHNLQQAMRVADYTAFFYLGRLIEYNETDAMFTNPKNRQTEDYITGKFG